MQLIAFDIETGPVDPEIGLEIRPFDPGRLVDPKKIEAAQEKHIDKFALFPTVAEVLAIQYATKDGILVETRWHFTEHELIRRFWDLVCATNRSTDLFCGWAIFRFDLPFLVARSRILGIEFPVMEVMRGKNFHKRWHDLERIWNCHVYGNYTSFEEACKALGWGGKPASGKNFHRMFKDEPEKAMEYCLWDAEHTYKMAQKILGGF